MHVEHLVLYVMKACTAGADASDAIAYVHMQYTYAPPQSRSKAQQITHVFL